MRNHGSNKFDLSKQINFLQIVLNLSVASSVQSTDLPEAARPCAPDDLFGIGTTTCRNRAARADAGAARALKITAFMGINCNRCRGIRFGLPRLTPDLWFSSGD
jgi:hypothetical protein